MDRLSIEVPANGERPVMQSPDSPLPSISQSPAQPSARPLKVVPRNPAACTSCRKAKVRCDIQTVEDGATACSRCLKTGRECLLPDASLKKRKSVPSSQIRVSSGSDEHVFTNGLPEAEGQNGQDFAPMHPLYASQQRMRRTGMLHNAQVVPNLDQLDVNLVNLDVGPTLDPVEAGVLSQGELQNLADFYYTRLHPLMPILDAELHTLQYVRSTSATLLCAIALAAATCRPEHAEIAQRLMAHITRLRNTVLVSKLCSVELILALTVLNAWPLDSGDGRPTLWLGVACAMARNLSIDRQFTQQRGHPDRREELNVPLELRRLQRARERAFLGLMVWDRTSALLHDHDWFLGDNRLPRMLDVWIGEPFTTQNDVVLADVLTLCLKCCDVRNTVETQVAADLGASVSPIILGFVRAQIDVWLPRARIASSQGTAPLGWQQEMMLALYQGHAQLWALALGLSYISSFNADLSTAVWRAAVGCSEAVVMHHEVLRHLPAPTYLMVSYGAKLTLNLAPVGDPQFPRSPIFDLVAQVAHHMRAPEAGSTTVSHPLGVHLLEILQQRADHDSPAPGRELWPPYRTAMIPAPTLMAIDASTEAATSTTSSRGIKVPHADAAEGSSAISSSMRSTLGSPASDTANKELSLSVTEVGAKEGVAQGADVQQ